MPTPGQSLLGFLSRDKGIGHLRSLCVVADGSDAALGAEWEAARDKLGTPVKGAGYPEVLDIPADGVQHIHTLVQQPWISSALQQPNMAGASFKLVEIQPLLAFQLTVDTARSNHHNGHAAAVPVLAETLAMCLPLAPANEPIQIHQSPGSLMISSRSLNFQAFARGYLQPNFVGLHVGVSLPLVHVVRFNGRCYLHNGFHRAVGLGKRGATHVPCVLRDVNSADEIGIKSDGTFTLDLLESANPPALGHFIEDRAYDVSLKAFKRTLHVSWAEYVTTDE